MRTVRIPIAGAVVQAEVERLDATDFVILWCDVDQVRSLGLSHERTNELLVRCELECLRLDAVEALGLVPPVEVNAA